MEFYPQNNSLEQSGSAEVSFREAVQEMPRRVCQPKFSLLNRKQRTVGHADRRKDYENIEINKKKRAKERNKKRNKDRRPHLVFRKFILISPYYNTI